MTLSNKQAFTVGLFFGLGLALANGIVAVAPVVVSALGGK